MTNCSTLDWRHKGIPTRAEGLAPDHLKALGLNLLDGDLMMPVALLRRSALDHNRAWMKRFVDLSGVSLAPHGKTTMSPELFAMQNEDGAWGMSAATAHHVRVYRHLGISRVLHANQLVAPADIDYILSELEADDTFDYYALADSVTNVRQLARAASARRLSRPLNLLVEIGGMDGRSGVRTVAEGLEVARAIHASPALSLRGIEAYEGIFQASPDGVKRMEEMLNGLAELFEACIEKRLFGPGAVLLTAGGSSFFDRCASRLKAIAHVDAQIVLRSGCYITHDAGLYDRLVATMMQRTPALLELGEGFRAALEVWSCVQSVPEPGRAIVALGKRDVGTDSGLPVPLSWFRPGAHGAPQPVQGVTVAAIYDQHVCLDSQRQFEVGDLVGFGVSHPCTTFDKWRSMLVVDDDYHVVSAITTIF